MFVETLEPRQLLTAAPLLGFAAPDVAAESSSVSIDVREYDPSRVLVGFPVADTARWEALIDDLVPGAELGQALSVDHRAFEVLLPSSVAVDNALAALQSHDSVLFAERNYRVQPSSLAPNDPDFNLQWALNNTGQTGGLAGADISALQAWSITTGHESVVVAVIDSGIDIVHSDLWSSAWLNPGEVPGDGIDNDRNGFIDDVIGWDFVDDDNDPRADAGHGTSVAGIIAAASDNGQGVTGLASQVKIMPLRVFDDSGVGYVSDIAKALRYAVQQGAVVSNHSYTVPFSTTLYDAIVSAQAADHIVVAAAGNQSSDLDVSPVYPAAYALDNVIAVAATDHNDQLQATSNYGDEQVDLAAPGVEIYSTVAGDEYDYLSGTSMAAPYVTGTVALVRSIRPDWNTAQVRSAVLTTVDPLASLEGKTVTGGRLNAAAAVSAAYVAEARIYVELSGDQVADGGSGVDLGTTSVGIPKSATLTVRNLGLDPAAEPLTLSSVIQLPAGFVLASGFGDRVLSAGESTTFEVTVNAYEPGTFQGTVSFDFSAAGATTDTFDFPMAVTVTPPVDQQFLDDGDVGFSAHGAWTSVSHPWCFHYDITRIAAGSGEQFATWEFDVRPGLYEVAATWPGAYVNATNATFAVYDGDQYRSSRLVNQQYTPRGPYLEYLPWEVLDRVEVTGNLLRVHLLDLANGEVVADGVYVKRVGDLPGGSVPVARDDVISVRQGQAVTALATGQLNLLHNDYDADLPGDTLTVTTTPATPVQHGTLTLNPDGTFLYEHDGSETTSDSFVYEVVDAKGNASFATVAIEVSIVNTAPVLELHGELKVATSGVGVIRSSLLKVTDAENSADQLTYTLVTIPERGYLRNGSTVLAVGGQFTQADIDAERISYTHDGSAGTADSFTFTVVDGAGGEVGETVFDIVIEPQLLLLDANGTAMRLRPESYSNQDVTYRRFLVEDKGVKISLSGNTWKRFDFGYSITPNTVMEFAFQSSRQGEVHAIGFDTDNRVGVNDPFFQLYGTESWGPFQDFADYDPAEGVKRYTIPLGEYFTGYVSQLVLVADDDARWGAESVFSDIHLYEARLNVEVSGTVGSYSLSSYSNQDVTAELYTVEDDGNTVRLSGNNWKRILLPYRITEQTVLEFDFQSGRRAEVHAIGFDTDNRISTSDPFFQLYGSQRWAKFQDFHDYDPALGVKHYVIPVGEYFTGDVNELVFAMDDDETRAGESVFSNVRIHEVNPNHAPVATDDSYGVAEGRTLNIPVSRGVLANDTDADGDSLAASLATGPNHGSLTLNADGSFSYTPETGFAGTDTFTYRAHDGSADSSPATVSISVAEWTTPIPELARWEEQMLEFATLHGDRFADGTYDFASTYYDAQRVYYQIADYTGDTKWLELAERVGGMYRDDYVVNAEAYGGVGYGAVPGYWNFTHGLAADYLRNGDIQSKQAVVELSRHAAYASDGTPEDWTLGADLSREVAYAINSYINAELVGEARRDRLGVLFEQALGHLDQWFVDRSDPIFAPFMFGLTAEALIYYWDHVEQDPRILEKLQMGADWIWANAWIAEKEAFYYRADGPSEAAADLNMLIAPIYGWLYLQTGDTTYRDRGDQVFAGGVKGAWLDGAKQFNQSYRSSFDYVKWRTQADGVGD